MSNPLSQLADFIVKDQGTVPCFVPSLNKHVDFKPLTLSSQKDIIEVSVESSVGILKFNNAIFNILKKCACDGVKVEEFTTVDRVGVCIALRAALSPEYKSTDLKSTVKANEAPFNVDSLTKVFTYGAYKFYLKVPSLALDSRINSILIENYNNSKLESADKVKQLISNLYVYEILKFVNTVESNGKSFDLHTDLRASISIIEQLPGIYTNLIIKFIQDIRILEAKYATMPETGTVIDITPEFFIV